jgi:hypothetical protein
VCTVDKGPGVTQAPGADAPADAPVELADPGLGAADAPVGSDLPALGTSSLEPAQPGQPTSAPAQLVATVERSVPGGVRALQVITISLFLLVLAGGWVGSWRERRRHAAASR